MKPKEKMPVQLQLLSFTFFINDSTINYANANKQKNSPENVENLERRVRN
jgi:hypothetical protein